VFQVVFEGFYIRAAADTTLIPVQAQYLSAKGLEQLLQTVQKVRQINPKLKIEGIVFPPMGVSRMGYGYCIIIYGQIRQKSLIFFVYL